MIYIYMCVCQNSIRLITLVKFNKIGIKLILLNYKNLIINFEIIKVQLKIADLKNNLTFIVI